MKRIIAYSADILKASINLLVFGILILCGTIPSSGQEPAPVAAVAAGNDIMTPYRMLATDTLMAFKAHDLPAAKKKARELEVTWDSREKALRKKSPELWGQIDKAMDAFIKPMQDKSPDPAKVQTAYDSFMAKLQLAVKAD
jgi:hypothetical protein